jgi:hypothetical protein
VLTFGGITGIDTGYRDIHLMKSAEQALPQRTQP